MVLTARAGRSTDPLKPMHSPIFGLSRNHRAASPVPSVVLVPFSGLRVPIKQDAQPSAAYDLDARVVDRACKLAAARISQASHRTLLMRGRFHKK